MSLRCVRLQWAIKKTIAKRKISFPLVISIITNRRRSIWSILLIPSYKDLPYFLNTCMNLLTLLALVFNLCLRLFAFALYFSLARRFPIENPRVAYSQNLNPRPIFSFLSTFTSQNVCIKINLTSVISRLIFSTDQNSRPFIHSTGYTTLLFPSDSWIIRTNSGTIINIYRLQLLQPRRKNNFNTEFFKRNFLCMITTSRCVFAACSLFQSFYLKFQVRIFSLYGWYFIAWWRHFNE